MTRVRARRALVGALAIVLLATPLACGADPGLQRQESSELATTCASLRERAGDPVVTTPPAGFLRRFLSTPPTDDGGLLTKDKMEAACTAAATTSTFGLAPPKPTTSGRVGS